MVPRRGRPFREVKRGVQKPNKDYNLVGKLLKRRGFRRPRIDHKAGEEATATVAFAKSTHPQRGYREEKSHRRERFGKVRRWERSSKEEWERSSLEKRVKGKCAEKERQRG